MALMVNNDKRGAARRRRRPASVILAFGGNPHRVDLAAIERAFFVQVVAGKYDAREDIAKAIGRSRSTVSRFFAGRSTSIRVFIEIMNELGLKFEDVATPVTEGAVTVNTSSPTLAECLSLADIRERFHLSQRALRVLVLSHGLPRYRRLGDNRLYLRVADVERALAEKAKKEG